MPSHDCIHCLNDMLLRQLLTGERAGHTATVEELNNRGVRPQATHADDVADVIAVETGAGGQEHHVASPDLQIGGQPDWRGRRFDIVLRDVSREPRRCGRSRLGWR